MKTKQSFLKSLSFILLFTSSSIIFAQPPSPAAPADARAERQNNKKEKIEAQKVAFITKKINLTPEEAQQFWPVYNQFENKIDELRKNRRRDLKQAKGNIDELTDKEVEQLVDNEILFKQKEIDLQKEYLPKFKAILSIKKIAKLYEAEEQFKRYLLNELKDKQQAAKD
jgi:hypothetical protein